MNRRAVLLDPGWHPGAGRACAEYAIRRGYAVVSVARDVAGAIAEIAAGRADVVIVLRSEQLRPLVQVVADAGGSETSLAERRPALRRTGRTPISQGVPS